MVLSFSSPYFQKALLLLHVGKSTWRFMKTLNWVLVHLRACWLCMVDIYREPREWKTVLQRSDGKSVIWSCGVVSHTFHYQSAFHNELEECSICYHRIPALKVWFINHDNPFVWGLISHSREAAWFATWAFQAEHFAQSCNIYGVLWVFVGPEQMM